MDEKNSVVQHRLVASAARYSLAVIFLLAGSSKATGVSKFTDVLKASLPISDTAAGVLSVSLLVSELAIGTGLLLSPYQVAFRRLGTLLLVGFTGYLASGYLRGEPTSDCGCILFLSMPTGWAIVRNLALIGVSGLAELSARIAERQRPNVEHL